MTHHEDYATLRGLIAGVDAQAKAMETKWGVDRLPALVSVDTRAKFERQRAKWRHALEIAYEADPITRPMLDLAQSTSGGMERAWAALDAEATAQGHGPLSPEVWEARGHDGKVIAIVRTVAEAAQVTQEGRHLAVYTLDEIANVIAALPEAVCTAKIQFPGAMILPPRSAADRAWVKSGDELPF